jgi:hypothetical protein
MGDEMRTKSTAVHALGLSLVALTLLAGCEGGGGTALVGGSEVPAAAVTVAVAPASVSAQVGQSAQLAAAVANVPAGAPFGVRWSSFDSGVASVSGSGLVSCNTAGSTVVVAQAEASAGASGRAAVTCTEAPAPVPAPQPTPAPTPTPAPVPSPSTPPPAAGLIVVNTSVLSFQYRAFVDSCPLPVGAFTVKNTSPARTQVEITAGHDSLELTPGSWDLQPGQESPHPVSVRFNCTAQASFTTHITITARSGGSSETKRIEVRATIL